MAGGYLPLTVKKLDTPEAVNEVNRMFKELFDQVAGDGQTVRDLSGYGSPESAVSASVGSTYRRLDGSAGTVHYVKESGTGATGWVAVQTSSSVPTGGIMPYGNASAPSGYLLCDGSAVSRSTYATLFGVISTTFGTGDGSTTFNVPDLRQRFPLGKATSGTGSTLGGTGGTVDHTHGGTTGSHVLTIAEMPSHSHTISARQNTAGSLPSAINSLGTVSVSTDSTGGGGGHDHTISSENPPFQTVVYIIKT